MREVTPVATLTIAGRGSQRWRLLSDCLPFVLLFFCEVVPFAVVSKLDFVGVVVTIVTIPSRAAYG